MTIELQPEVTYRNRRAGLVFFGVLLMALGGFVGLMAVLILVTLAAAPDTAGMSPRMMIPSVGLYVIASVLLIVLGIGSLMSRRWAHALTLVVSWMWLIVGVFTALAMVFMMPRVLDAMPAEQAQARPVIYGCLALVTGIFFVLLPLAFVLFYRSPHVKDTVEHLDPVPRWTDRVPISVLGFSTWMMISALSVTLCSFMYRALPVGPWMLRGPAVTILFLAMGAFLVLTALGIFRLDIRAWWAAIGFLVLGVAFCLITFPGLDFQKWYEAMEMPMPPQQVEMMSSMYRSPLFIAWLVVLWAGYVAFLLYIRRYFVRSRPGDLERSHD